MLNRFFVTFSLILMLASLGMAQNANTSTPPTRQRTVVAKPAATPRPAAKGTTATGPQTTTSSSGVQRTQTNTSATPAPVGTPSGVLAAFNALLEGIRHADVDAVANAYLK